MKTVVVPLALRMGLAVSSGGPAPGEAGEQEAWMLWSFRKGNRGLDEVAVVLFGAGRMRSAATAAR